MRELAINLNPDTKEPLYEQIYSYIRSEIRKGQLLPGERLPSTRSLSAFLEVSRSTVDLAYEQLVSEGYLEAVPWKGYYVCRIEGLYSLSPERGPVRERRAAESSLWDYDLTPNGIDLEHFPYEIWRRLTRNVLLDDRKELFQLGDPKGEWELREAISRYLHQARGVLCRPEQVILGAGNDYLLLLLAAVLGTGRSVAMESPTYEHAYRIFRQLGFPLTAVPMDAQGMDVERLSASGADIAYVMPSHQYPLGVVMPIKRRLELLKWASEKADRYLIEDDYDSEFRYKGKPIPALQGSDRDGRVIYLGTFSKSIAPAIRISYLVLPQPLLSQTEEKLACFSSTVSRIDQMVLNQFIREGHFERHLNRMRRIYGRKHDIFLEKLKELSGVIKITGENAGVHLLAEFQNGMSEEEALQKARNERVRVYPLSEYRTESSGTGERREKAAVLLGYATLTEEELSEAAARLTRAWKQDAGSALH